MKYQKHANNLEIDIKLQYNFNSTSVSLVPFLEDQIDCFNTFEIIDFVFEINFI
jgi:hypothetical protein